ncbi:MAG TPA: hypothetical protein PLP01_02690 [Phycisphaerae bacterium]|nr:hypothetical protein [Phycisphaerae bacterium]HOI54134.1 hypothetical protein [Phycisphaerae bacterium]
MTFHLGDHATREPYDWIGVAANNPDILRNWCDQRGLFCPNCEYALRGVEGTGLAACPECGHPIDFDRLRLLRLYGYDLGKARDVIKGVLLRPTAYLRQFKGPQYYLRTAPEHNCSFWATAAGTIGVIVLTGIAAMFDRESYAGVILCPIVFLPLAFAATHLAAYGWFRVMLALAGRKATDRGASRIMYFASVAYLLLVLPAWMLGAAAVVASAGSVLGVDLTMASMALAFAAVALLLAVAVGWGYVAMVAFNIETYGRSPMLAMLALANPVTAAFGGISALALALTAIEWMT